MYTDLLTKIKNAQAVKKEFIKTPYSRFDEKIAEILSRHHYIESVEKKGRMPKRILEIKLKYAGGKGVISGIKFLSKPSRKLYLSYRNLRPVKHGYGLALISTPKGVMTFQEARKRKVGGEILFEIW
jgi:small subunit ribosomal protein S8